LSLKIGSYNLMIWVSKLPRWFLDLGLKTKQTLICWLRHKIDGWMRRCETCVEIYRVASRVSKSGLKIGGGCVRVKLKTDEMM
jgi:hypothetical protein